MQTQCRKYIHGESLLRSNTITYFRNKLKLISASGNVFIHSEDNNDNGDYGKAGKR